MRSRCRCALKKVFSLSGCFAWAKKLFFSAKQKVFVYRKLYALLSKASRFRNQNTACSNYFLLLQKPPFLLTKTYLLQKPFLACFKKRPFSQTKSLSFAQTFPYSHPKQLFSTLHLPFAPPLTYCLQRIQPFFCSSLNSLRCKAWTSHRFKSLPAIPGEVAAFRKTGYLMMAAYFSKNHVSTGDLNRGSQGFAPRAFWLLFARCKK